jgi:hypothetical protein
MQVDTGTGRSAWLITSSACLDVSQHFGVEPLHYLDDVGLSFFFFLFPHVAPSDCQHVPAAISHSGNIYTQFFY